MTRINGTLHEDQYTFLIIARSVPLLIIDRSVLLLIIARSVLLLIIARSVPLRMKNASDESSRENKNTHFVFSNLFKTARL
jgi:hypothetical protein